MLFAHPHDPNEEDGVAEEEETDGKVVEQGLREPRLEEEGALELGQRLRPGLVVVLCHHDHAEYNGCCGGGGDVGFSLWEKRLKCLSQKT